jgi:CRP/FNR family transcriptional regulator, cyclic AMP receptor protein
MYEDILATVPLFSGLTSHDLQNLTAGARERTYASGETLMAQGAPSAALFVLTEGKVRVFQKTDAGERELRVMGPGEVVGEYSVLTDLPRTASVIAMEPTKAILIPSWDFRAALNKNPEIGLKLLSKMAERLLRMEQDTGHR